MSKVAQDFGISDVALKKICKKHRVPSPPRGYWAKKDAGKPVKQVRFASTADPSEERVTIYGGYHVKLPEPVREILQSVRKRAATGRPKSEIDSSVGIAPIEAAVHSSIAASAKALRTRKPNKDGVVSAKGSGCCGMEISPSNVERCIVILDALAMSLEEHALLIRPLGTHMAVEAEGETISFRLSEHIRRDKHIPSVEELATEERRRKRLGITWDSPYGRSYPDWDFVRTGEMIIEIDNQYADGLRRRWRDGKKQRLENLVREIAVGIKAYAVALRLRREECERERLICERRMRVRARARARQEREEERGKVLDELVAISVKANKLRTWLEEALRWPERPQPDEFTRFVDWARGRLEYLEQVVEPDGISESIRERELFPEVDPLIDPPEDLVEE